MRSLKKVLLEGALLLSFIAVITGFISVICFVFAVTPAEAVANGGPKIPAGWEAGFFNHGSYIRWHVMSKHPIEFALSVVILGCGVFGVYYFKRKLGYK